MVEWGPRNMSDTVAGGWEDARVEEREGARDTKKTKDLRRIGERVLRYWTQMA